MPFNFRMYLELTKSTEGEELSSAGTSSEKNTRSELNRIKQVQPLTMNICALNHAETWHLNKTNGQTRCDSYGEYFAEIDIKFPGEIKDLLSFSNFASANKLMFIDQGVIIAPGDNANGSYRLFSYKGTLLKKASTLENLNKKIGSIDLNH